MPSTHSFSPYSLLAEAIGFAPEDVRRDHAFNLTSATNVTQIYHVEGLADCHLTGARGVPVVMERKLWFTRP